VWVQSRGERQPGRVSGCEEDRREEESERDQAQREEVERERAGWRVPHDKGYDSPRATSGKRGWGCG